ncbi:outer membrane beta-barrel protein [uncultured Shewanella sp.]|uniref:outer membrane beta-barrel protein n=1 Tax=Shewanella atlantica TaxID=271099 RepID=UPI0026279C41|nr:outer membrane beta-barrel protein [uncultured Shewanella sp.]
MKKYILASGLILTSLSATANQAASETAPTYKPKMSISLDYIPATNKMYGVTLAPYHYDKDYANWGYYIGYAASQKDDMDVPEPGEGYTKDTMWRFGLSYSLSSSFSIYGGAASYNHESHYTNNIVPFIIDGEPVWEEESDTSWGAEIGLRYMMDSGLMIGAGYNSASESAVISIGYAM